MFGHGIVQAVIAPFFVLMALAMVLSRIGLVAAKADRLPKVEAPAEELVAA